MVSTEKCYKSDNFPVLHQAVLREEYLFQVRLYQERAAFLSSESGLLRMRVLLGFIEARVTVVDAVIKTDGRLHYLSVICASGANPLMFSRIMKRIAPHAIIEEIKRRYAEERLSTGSVRDEAWNFIPYAASVKSVNESRRFLYALLLEYRALLSECSAIMKQESSANSSRASGYTVQFLIFEQNGTVCGIPDFQIEKITPGANGSQILQLSNCSGQRVLICEELICYKEIDIVQARFGSKVEKGHYRVSARATGGDFAFNLIVPSFL